MIDALAIPTTEIANCTHKHAWSCNAIANLASLPLHPKLLLLKLVQSFLLRIVIRKTKAGAISNLHDNYSARHYRSTTGGTSAGARLRRVMRNSWAVPCTYRNAQRHPKLDSSTSRLCFRCKDGAHDSTSLRRCHALGERCSAQRLDNRPGRWD